MKYFVTLLMGVILTFQAIEGLSQRSNKESDLTYLPAELGYRSGFFPAVSAGTMWSKNPYYGALEAELTFEVLGEYRHSPIINIALGATYSRYQLYKIIPVFIQYNIYTNSKKWPVYGFGKLGHGFLVDPVVEGVDQNGGLHVGFGAGVQKGINSDYIKLQIGYQVQKASERYDYQSYWIQNVTDTVTIYRNMNRIVVLIGWVF